MCSKDTMLRNKFTAYLELVVKHGKFDYLRVYLRRKRREELFDTLPQEMTIYPDEPSRMCGQRFQHALLDRAFDTLSETRQKILTCFFVHRMTAREIARIYGYTERYVYTLKYRALSQLRDYMANAERKSGSDEE